MLIVHLFFIFTVQIMTYIQMIICREVQLKLLKGIVHPTNEHYVIIYSPSNCSKVSFFCWTQKKIFWKMLVTKRLAI